MDNLTFFLEFHWTMKTIMNKISHKPFNISHMFRVTINLTQSICRRGYCLDETGTGVGFF